MESFNISGRTAVLLGCSSEISRAVACALAVAGAVVVAVDSDMTSFKPMEEALTADGYRVECIEAEIRSGVGMEPLAELVYQKCGSLDILINNLGNHYAPNTASDADIGDDTWETVVSRGLMSAFSAVRAVAPYMQKNGKGKIVHIASFTGRVGFVFNGADYCVFNAGLTSMVRQLSIQYADTGININAIAPGPVEGDCDRYSGEEMALILKKTPLKRLCRPEEVAAAAIYLVSDQSDYVVGETMNINGGLYMM